jgi:aldehyde dehydrogenase (NAD+)
LLEYRDVYAGGRLVGSGSDDVIPIVNPATEEVAGAVPSMVERDGEIAGAAARQAFDSGLWPLASPADRAAAMDRLAAALEARAEDTARLVTAEMGMPITLSRRSNVSVPCAIIRYYAALARDLSTEEVREAISFAGRTMVRREPAGVAAVIASWSYPLILAFCQLAPALAAGCTVVLLPAAETSLSAYILAEAFEAAEFPPGVFNLVTGTAEVGEMLAADTSLATLAQPRATKSGRRISTI